MAFSCDDDEEGEPPLTKSQAEITLKQLLDRQLSTSGRLEQVEFQQATENIESINWNSGISSLQEFLKTESAQKERLEKTRFLQNVLDDLGYSKEQIHQRCQKVSCIDVCGGTSSDKGSKRRRYGADPLFLSHSQAEECQIASLECEHRLKEELANKEVDKCRPPKDVKVPLAKVKDRFTPISHLSPEAISSRKPLSGIPERINEHLTMTPQDRARQSAEAESSRLVNEVFSSPAPEVLNLHAFLRQRSDSMPCFAENIHSKDLSEEKKQVDDLSSQNHYVATISEDEIIRNCLSLDEIRELPCGKFRNYSPGIPSKVLYVKNLAKDVTEADLVSLFVRYQVEHQPLLFRLMKKGRMKGQAFVTFSDVETSSKALQLLNGYILRGKPMVIQFGHGNTETSYMHSKDANE